MIKKMNLKEINEIITRPKYGIQDKPMDRKTIIKLKKDIIRYLGYRVDDLEGMMDPRLIDKEEPDYFVYKSELNEIEECIKAIKEMR